MTLFPSPPDPEFCHAPFQNTTQKPIREILVLSVDVNELISLPHLAALWCLCSHLIRHSRQLDYASDLTGPKRMHVAPKKDGMHGTSSQEHCESSKPPRFRKVERYRNKHRKGHR